MRQTTNTPPPARQMMTTKATMSCQKSEMRILFPESVDFVTIPREQAYYLYIALVIVSAFQFW